MSNCLATLWFPDLKPFGWPTVWAVLYSLFFLVCLQLSRKGGKLTGLFILLSLAGPLVATIFSYGSIPFAMVFGGRMFPDADDIISGFVYLAFGFGMSLSVVRTFPFTGDKIIGIFFMLVYTGLIALNIWVWAY